MALLSFRLSIVFTIGLLLLNGFTSDTSVLAFVNEEGPERLRLIAAPPSHVIVTSTRSSPVYLPCQAELAPDTTDDIPNSSYGDDYPDEHNEEDDEEEEDDEGYDEDTDDQEDEEDGFLPHTAPLLNNNDLSHDERSLHRLQRQQPPDVFQRQYRDYEGDEVRRRRRRRRYVRTQGRGFAGRGGYYGGGGLATFEYVWYRNGLEFLTTSFQNQNHRQTHKGFRLFENGTLRIPYNRQNANIAAGVYRCKATLIHHNPRNHGQGSILSTECTVSIAYLDRDNGINFPNNTITVRACEPTILPCPFQSYPAANITWSVNKTTIPLQGGYGNTKDARFFLLQNGSLLISDVQLTDSGRYRCNASNLYVAKNFRSSSVNLVVSATAPSSAPQTTGNHVLMPPLQPLQLSVPAGNTLRLHCACYYCKPQWTFTPRHSQIPIPLDNLTHQVMFVNASVERHEGSFTCRSSPDATAERQTFNVTVLVAPTFVSRISSYISSVVASMTFNCSVSGNPPPTVTWYKNGRAIRSNYIMHYAYPLLRINTLDPEDEGLYQCVAKNAAGEIAASTYLTIRDKQKYRHKAKRLDAIRCFPIDTTSLYLTFNVPSHANPGIEYVMYYLAGDDPFRWFSSPPTQLAANGSLRITGRMVEPFRNYTVFLRACSVSDISGTENILGGGTPGMKKVIPSRLSQGVQCASQGYPILSTFFPNNGIFIWWPKYEGVEPTAFTIQLQHDGNGSLTSFTEQIIGTVDPLDDYMTYEEVEPLLGKIAAKTSQHMDWLWNDDEGDVVNEESGVGRRRRRRRQSHQRENRHEQHAFDLSKDRKQIFGWLATSGDAVDVDVALQVDAEGNRTNLSDVQAAMAAAQQSASAQQQQSATMDASGKRTDGLTYDDPQFRKTHREITVMRVKVAGNVTGILLPNMRSVKVRVLGSIAPDGEPLQQDLRYVLWKTIDTAAPRTDAINRFQASHIDARSVQFTWSRFVATKAVNRCLQLCYKNVNHDVILRGGSSRFDCQKIPKDGSHFNVKDLLPLTMYKAFLKPCESKEALSDIVDFQTKHDVPGPVTNHELDRSSGTISITWGPPEKSNGVLQGYLIEWINEENTQHAANLTANATSFTFPNVTSNERINISIRALSSSGLGIPIYLNMKNYYPPVNPPGKIGSGGALSAHSMRWLTQILFAVIMLLFLILIATWLWFVLRRKACKKASNGAGSGNAGGAAGGSGATPSSDGRHHHHHHHHMVTDGSAVQMMGILSSCNSDMHEMQTLIRPNNCSHPNGGLSIPNGFGGGSAGSLSYANSPPLGTNVLPVATSLVVRNRSQPVKNFSPTTCDTTINVPLNVTVPAPHVNGTNDYATAMASYKELLGRERTDTSCTGCSGECNREGCGSIHIRNPTALASNDACVVVSAMSPTDVMSSGDELHNQKSPEYLAACGSSTSTNKKDSDRISSTTLATTGERKRSPTLSFASKSSRAAIPSTSMPSSSPTSSSSSSSSSSSTSTSSSPSSSATPSSLTPASSQYVMKSRSPLALDSSQRRLLDTTLDSNTSTTNVAETDVAQRPKPKPPISNTQQTLPVEIYDYATNCDDEQVGVRDNSRQRLLLAECSDEVPEIVSTVLPRGVLRNAGRTQEATDELIRQQNAVISLPRSQMNPMVTSYREANGGADVSSRPEQIIQSYSLKSDNDAEDDDDEQEENDDEDDEELDNSASLLNTSSLSTKPLHQQNHTSSWNFRRPIIGPNG
ncbi:uncharacterized protein LOC131284066 [Anopheles ziemanni]|uniref:uncharacterized protein LOC131261091 n=1 Tax=Anopheles coustani TaxID=139045 RepID=UPI00265A0BBF|nr:uncharacterized protein LOC131261091 [Anopheles coustani]XP_058168903.1 uncharacterized protein LOC131284066 [Anopheles ziemanni]